MIGFARALLLLSIPAACLAQPVGNIPTTATTPDGHYISWREHLIDDPEIGGIPLSGSDGLVMGDLDGDGYEDIVSVHEADTKYAGQAEGYVRIAFGTGDPDRWVNVTLAEGAEAAAAEDAAIGDLNGDGFPDVIASCELAHLIYFQNPGEDVRTATWKRIIPEITLDRGSFIRVFLGDFNGDGALDVLTPNKGGQNPSLETEALNPISVFTLEGDPLEHDSWKEHVLGRNRIPINAVPVDLDRDGDLDVVGGSRGERRMMWFENSGDGTFAFTEHPINFDDGYSTGFNMTFGDLSGDGRLDIVIVASGTPGSEVAWLEQPADFANAWAYHVVGVTAPDTAVSVELADINDDGRDDIMCGSYSRGPRDKDGEVGPDSQLGLMVWFEQPEDARAVWPRHNISRRVRGMFDKFIARDMDADGDIDFVGTRGNSHPYDGVFWLEQVRSDTPRPSFVPARETDSAEVALP
jgi:hypothetical protein